MLIVIIKDRDLTDHKWNGAGWSILFTILSLKLWLKETFAPKMNY